MRQLEPLRGQICDLEAYLEAPALAALLKEVAEGIRSGTLTVGTGNDVRSVRIDDNLLFELHLLQGAGDVLAVEISWRRDETAGADGLVITS